jgi:tetratricopeptide (TPR) repeat protein
MKKSLLTLVLLISLAASAQSPVERARKLFEENKPVEARSILLTVKDSDKEYASAQYYLGRIAIQENKMDDAEDYFEEAIEANDKVSDYHTWLGNTYGQIAKDANMFKQGMLAPKMKAEWEKAVALDPKSIEPRLSLIQYYLQAPGIMGGSIDKAKETAKQVMVLNPPQGHLQMGNIYYKEKKMVEAEKEFVEMVRLDPAYTAGLANFYIGQKQYDKAFALFEDALKKSPDDMATIYQLGKASALSGQRLERGEECLKKYLNYTPKKNEPSLAGANMRLAQIMEKKGNKPEARKLFEQALGMDGTLKEAKEGLERVK